MKYKNANELILDKLVLLGDKNQFKMLLNTFIGVILKMNLRIFIV